MIAACDVALRIGSRLLMHDVGFTLQPGEFVALLGPNGVGKTTLLRSLTGLHPIAGGSIQIDGVPIAALSPRDRARRIAFLAADEVLDDALTVRDVVSTGRYAHHRWWEWREAPSDELAIDGALGAVQMESYAQRRFATLSSGERQRIWIAMALAQESPVMLLDEPTSHLDIRVSHAILGLLRERARAGMTILCAIHDINEAAAFADRMIVLGCERMLACASPYDVLQGNALERAYGIAMRPLTLPDGSFRVFPIS